MGEHFAVPAPTLNPAEQSMSVKQLVAARESAIAEILRIGLPADENVPHVLAALREEDEGRIGRIVAARNARQAELIGRIYGLNERIKASQGNS